MKKNRKEETAHDLNSSKMRELLSFSGNCGKFILEIYQKRNMYMVCITDYNKKSQKRCVYKSTSFKNSMKYFNSSINSYTNNMRIL